MTSVPTSIIRAARVITPDGERPASIVIRDGMIVEVGELDAAPDLGEDMVLLPGLVDSHVHVNEPGRTEWEGFATATAAAAAGGVTTIVDMPLNSIPATVDVAALRTKQRAADGQLAVDVAFWGGAVPGNAGELRALHDAGVVGFKCFLLDSGVPEFPPLDNAGLALAMETIAGFGGLLIAHAEDPGVIDAAPRAHGRRYADFVASRPQAAESVAVQTLLAQTRRTGCRTHVVHVSGAASLPLIRAAKDEGLPVTAETCPHYLTLRAEDVPDGATQFKCCPPIRDEPNRELLWAGLSEGTIDCVVSDHSPCTVAAKRLDSIDARSAGAPLGADARSAGAPLGADARSAGAPLGADARSAGAPLGADARSAGAPLGADARSAGAPLGGDFGAAWGGIASVQLGLPTVWTEAARRGVPLTDLVRWMCAAPAELTGLAGRGAIAPGHRADLTAFAPDAEFVVDPRRLRHRNPISPYAGRTLRGVVHRTWLAGVPVSDEQPRRGRMVAAR